MSNKIIIYLVLFLVFVSCGNYMVSYFSPPEYFPVSTYNFKKNPLTKRKVELGRKLFYDPILSKDSTISCASCHSVYNSFAHTDHNLSHGTKDRIGTRNAPALINLAWSKTFMWDGAINHLDMQALAPITNPLEMDENIKTVINKLEKNTKYKELFYKAFGKREITTDKILQSLSQFQLTIISSHSKYDSVKLGMKKFTLQEERGYRIFEKNCSSCHTEPLFTNNLYEKNALPMDEKLKDFGRMNITKDKKDSLLFKVPTLRNLSYTYPYMHDGRFKKIGEVINHYSNKIPPHYSEKLRRNLNFSSNEKVDLVTFLLTLNDVSIFKNKNFLAPKQNFRRK